MRSRPAPRNPDDEHWPLCGALDPLKLQPRQARLHAIPQHALQAACFRVGVHVRETLDGLWNPGRLPILARFRDAVEEVAADGIREGGDVREELLLFTV